MGHPDRKRLRQRKKNNTSEDGLAKKNMYGVKDLTPYNAVGKIIHKRHDIKIK